jgi:hypothetical protein
MTRLDRVRCQLETERDSHRSTAQEHKRLLEKMCAQLQAKTREQQAATEQLTRELQRCQFERSESERRRVEAETERQAQLAKVTEGGYTNFASLLHCLTCERDVRLLSSKQPSDTSKPTANVFKTLNASSSRLRSNE